MLQTPLEGTTSRLARLNGPIAIIIVKIMAHRNDAIATAHQNNRDFELVYDELVGTYIYVFENGVCIYDFLQDSVAMAKEFALSKFGLAIESWQNLTE